MGDNWVPVGTPSTRPTGAMCYYDLFRLVTACPNPTTARRRRQASFSRYHENVRNRKTPANAPPVRFTGFGASKATRVFFFRRKPCRGARRRLAARPGAWAGRASAGQACLMRHRHHYVGLIPAASDAPGPGAGGTPNATPAASLPRLQGRGNAQHATRTPAAAQGATAPRRGTPLAQRPPNAPTQRRTPHATPLRRLTPLLGGCCFAASPPDPRRRGLPRPTSTVRHWLDNAGNAGDAAGSPVPRRARSVTRAAFVNARHAQHPQHRLAPPPQHRHAAGGRRRGTPDARTPKPRAAFDPASVTHRAWRGGNAKPAPTQARRMAGTAASSLGDGAFPAAPTEPGGTFRASRRAEAAWCHEICLLIPALCRWRSVAPPL